MDRRAVKEFFKFSVWLLLPGLIFFSCSQDADDVKLPVVTPETALQMYIHNSDETFDWEVITSFQISDITVYDLLLTSQLWHDITWKHQLTILVPAGAQYEEALLWITGGRLENGEPVWTNGIDEEALAFGLLATNNQAVTAVLRQTPNQPLFSGLTEDALISYTLNNFRNDGDYSWPLLFPMVKSAVRAMDAVEECLMEHEDLDISGFVVAGASKRGWTTWLTGASDDRVRAIAPAVIDIVNMPVNLDYQLEVWGDYSPEIQDYVDLGIAQDVHTQLGADLATMIDPYSYLDELTMPKMIFIGTNDPYWPVDAVKHYFGDLPGKNYIHYVANAGHDLNGGEEAIPAIGAFFFQTISNQSYPECSWEVTETGTEILLEVTGSSGLVQAAYLWSANSQDRDFRDEEWNAASLGLTDNSSLSTTIEYPAEGYQAFYVNLEYADPNNGDYTLSTRVFVTDEDEIL